MIRALSALCLAILPHALAAQQATEDAEGALLRALDKVTGKTTDLSIERGQSEQVGRLSVRVEACRYPAGNRASDAFAALQIREEGSASPVFEGWMIASAPALNALDHAQYDVWVIRCLTTS